MEFIHNNETAVKIQWNKKFKFYEALTAAVDPRTKQRIHKYGNDWNCHGGTVSEVETKVKLILSD